MNDPNAPRVFRYVAIDVDVRHGMELICTARTKAMAKRIAFALNRYRTEYRRKNETNDLRKQQD